MAKRPHQPDLSHEPQRRDVLKVLLGGGLSVAVSGCSRRDEALHSPRKTPPVREVSPAESASIDLRAVGPIDRGRPGVAPRLFSGDPSPEALHEALWSPQSYLEARGGLPKPSEQVPLVIIGGGMSGLLSAYHLRDQRFVLLEQGPRLGGNSRGEAWQGLEYSIGAAYFAKPTPGTSWAAFLDEVGASKRWTVNSHVGTVGLQGRIAEGFWEGETVPKDQRSQVIALATHLRRTLAGSHGLIYPEIPCEDAATREKVNALDRVSLLEHVRGVLKAVPRGQLRTFLEYYCWSTLGGGTSEVSAASALNNLAAEFGELVVMPGGNAALAECLLTALSPHLAPGSIRPRSLVIDLRVVDAGVAVTYVDSQGAVRQIMAKAVIAACPKFVVKRILHGLEPERREAIEKIRYRGYLVANVLLQGAPRHHLPGVYMFNDGEEDFGDLQKASERAGTTDLVLANYARPEPHRTVLTLYRAFPYDGARGHMLSPDFYDAMRQATERQLERQVLPMMGFEANQLRDLRLSRWGHAIPLARPGLIAEGLPEVLGRPFHQRIFFVEQDTWLSPWVESIASQAEQTAAMVRAILTT